MTSSRTPLHAPAAAAGAAKRHGLTAWPLWVGLSVVLLSALLLVATLAYLRQQTLEGGRRQAESLAHLIAEQTYRSLQAVDLRLQVSATRMTPSPEGVALAPEVGRAMLREDIRQLGFVRAMWVLDAQGRIVQDSDVGNLGLPLDDRAYFQVFQQHPDTGLYLSAPFVSRTTQTWLLAAARPLKRPDGRLAGVIVAAIEPPYFGQLWRSAEPGQDVTVQLFRNDGTLMMNSPFDGDALVPGSLRQAPLPVASLGDGPGGMLEDRGGPDGEPRLLAFRRLDAQSDLIVTVSRPTQGLLAPWATLARVTAALWAAAAIVVMLLNWRLARAQAEREQGRRQMAESEQQLRLALRGGNLGWWDWDVPQGTLVVNARWRGMLGLPSDAPAPTLDSWHALVHPQDQPRLDALVDQVILSPTGLDFEIEVRARHADGHWIWVLDSGAVTERDPAGQPLRVTGTHRDITKRKTAEAALRASEQHLAITLQSIGDAVISTDAAGNIDRMNLAAERLTGWPSADARGRPLAEVFRVIDEHTRQALPNPVDQVFAQGQAVELANGAVLIARNGREIPVADSAAPIQTAQGDVVGAVLVFSDISARHEAQTRLRHNEARLQTLLANLPAGVLVCGPQAQIVEANAVACALLGATLDELSGAAVTDSRWGCVGEDGEPLPEAQHPVHQALASHALVRDQVIGPACCPCRPARLAVVQRLSDARRWRPRPAGGDDAFRHQCTAPG